MGQPVKIYDLAVEIIKMSGFEPDKDIEIVETGLRPGEKLYEELLVKDETLIKTDNEKIFIEKDEPLSMQDLNERLNILSRAMYMGSNKIAKAALKEVVPTYVNGDGINKEEPEPKKGKKK